VPQKRNNRSPLLDCASKDALIPTSVRAEVKKQLRPIPTVRLDWLCKREPNKCW
jgi:hypothetical protein